jgi:hypothetical protein
MEKYNIMNITCCEVALSLGISNVISLAIFAGYTIKMKVKIRKEQEQINELKEIVLELKQRMEKRE